ncbi:MAG: hypothetical protein COB76_03895 [Alphaproteobacteria bacterium]|nr:MAG: hypothetical protein COB76_03895 [Alphaproteobacteria bacterium]
MSFWGVLPNSKIDPKSALEKACPDICFVAELLTLTISKGIICRNGQKIEGIAKVGTNILQKKMSLYGFEIGDVDPEYIANLPEDVEEKRRELCRRFDLAEDTIVDYDPKYNHQVLTPAEVEKKGLTLVARVGNKLTYSLPTVFNNLVEDGIVELSDEVIDKIQANTRASKVDYLPRKGALRLTFASADDFDKNCVPQDIYNVFREGHHEIYRKAHEAVDAMIDKKTSDLQSAINDAQSCIDEAAKKYGFYPSSFKLKNFIP